MELTILITIYFLLYSIFLIFRIKSNFTRRFKLLSNFTILIFLFFYSYLIIFQFSLPLDFLSSFSDKNVLILNNDIGRNTEFILLEKNEEDLEWDIIFTKSDTKLNPIKSIEKGDKNKIEFYSKTDLITLFDVDTKKSNTYFRDRQHNSYYSELINEKKFLINYRDQINDLLLLISSIFFSVFLIIRNSKEKLVYLLTIIPIVSFYYLYKLTLFLIDINSIII